MTDRREFITLAWLSAAGVVFALAAGVLQVARDTGSGFMLGAAVTALTTFYIAGSFALMAHLSRLEVANDD